ncbi:MAG TPA: formate/nitrite transporter family protein [Nitrospiraceae bacterium]|nr:formate/nitrite transporter family protein [Nitrospiraceae bacterium]
MEYVKPHEVVTNMLAAGATKLNLSPRHLVIRGMLAGAYLGIATSMAVAVAVETGYWIIGSMLFPFGLALAILLGTEIITGSFALLPCAAVAGKENARVGQVLANWSWVFLGNLLGSLLYAILFAIAITTGGDAPMSVVGTKLIALAESKTNYYALHGSAGLLAVFTKGILCNWMVSLAVVAALASTSFSGKMLAIWGPTVLFFSQGFEHAVVNMFVIPVGILLGAHVNLSTWWLWNQIPVTLGNLVGGMVFTGLAIYFTHRQVTPVAVPASLSVTPQQSPGAERAEKFASF